MGKTQDINKNGGWLNYTFISAGGGPHSHQICTGSGKLGPWHISNVDAANVANVRFYDIAAAPTVGTTPEIDRLTLNKASQIAVGGDGFEGIPFETGLYIYISSAAAKADNTALTTSDVTGSVRYATRESGYSG